MKYLLLISFLAPWSVFAANELNLTCKSYKDDQFKVTYSVKIDSESSQLLSDISWKFENDGEVSEGTYKAIAFEFQKDKSFSLKGRADGEGVSLDATRRGHFGYQGWGSMLKIDGTNETSLFDFPVVCSIQ